MSEYVWRMHILIGRDSLAAAQDAAERALPGGADERRMFEATVGADGTERADAADADLFGCSTLMTEAQRDALTRAFDASGVAAKWIRLVSNEQRAVAGSSGLAFEPGRRWEWADTLGAIGASHIMEAANG